MNSVKIEIKWGIILLLLSLIWMVAEKVFGLHGSHIDKHPIFTNLVFIPAIFIFVFALREKRDKFYEGKMSWKQGFYSGFLIGVIIALLNPVGQLISHKLISPAYFQNMIEYSVELQKTSQQQAENYFSLKNYILQKSLSSLFLAVIVSAIIAFFVKRK